MKTIKYEDIKELSLELPQGTDLFWNEPEVAGIVVLLKKYKLWHDEENEPYFTWDDFYTSSDYIASLYFNNIKKLNALYKKDLK